MAARRKTSTITGYGTHSPAFQGIAYDAKTRRLAIRFSSSSMYTYDDVPPAVVEQLVNDPAPAKFFHAFIRGVYTYTRQGTSEPE